MLRLVEHDGQRVVHVPAQPHLRAVRALRRAEPTVRKGHPSTSADDRTRPLRPDELPPSVLRDRPELAAPLLDRLAPSLVRRHADLAVDLEAVAVVHMVVDRRERRVDVDLLALGFDVHTGGRPPWGGVLSLPSPCQHCLKPSSPLSEKPFRF